MLKRILHLSLLFISLSFVSLYAFDFSEFGFKDIQKRVSGSYTVYSMSDESGRDVKISLSPDIPEARIVLLLSVYTAFDQWNSISFDTLSVITETEYTSFMVLPTRISYSGVDLLSYVRSGLSFVQENDSLIYDIRLVNAAVNPKLSGTFTSEQELLKALYEAVEIDLLGILYMGISQESRQAQSVAPVQQREPEELPLPEQMPESEPESPGIPLQPVPDDLLAGVRNELKAELNDIVNEAVSALKEDAAKDLDYEVKILSNDIDILSQVVSQDREDRDREAAELQDAVTLLQQDLSGIKNDLSRERDERKRLEEEVSLFREELDDLRKAILTIHNTGIFGNIRHVDRKAIDRAVSLKDRDEDITQSEMYTTLNREGYAVSEHAVFLIYALYFNEYY